MISARDVLVKMTDTVPSPTGTVQERVSVWPWGLRERGPSGGSIEALGGRAMGCQHGLAVGRMPPGGQVGLVSLVSRGLLERLVDEKELHVGRPGCSASLARTRDPQQAASTRDC